MPKTNEKVEKATLTPGEERSLRAAAKKFSKAWGSAARGDIMARYAVGEEALAVEKKYGRVGVEALAKAINRSPAYVYSYAAVVKTWNRGQLRDLLKRAEGKIEWSHVVLLSNKKLVDDKRRAGLLKQISSDGMSPTELKLELYPKAAPAPADLDPDLVEDGVVDEQDAAATGEPASATASPSDSATPSTPSVTVPIDADADDDDGEDGGEDDGDDDGDDDGEDAEPGHGLVGVRGKVSFSRRVRSLRRYSEGLTTLAKQTELVNDQVFTGFEEAVREKRASDSFNSALENLALTKTAAEEAQRFSQATIRKCDELIEAVRAEMTRLGAGAAAPGTPDPVQMSGTQPLVPSSNVGATP